MPSASDRFAETAPPRPSLPPLLIAGLALWGTAAVLWPLAGRVEGGLLAALLGSALVVGAAWAVWCLRRRAVPVRAVIGLAVLAAVIAVGAAALSLRSASEAAYGYEGPRLCTLTTDAKPSEFGWRAEGRLTGEGLRPVRVRVNLPAEAAGMLRGAQFAVGESVAAPDPAFRERSWEAGLAGTVTVGEASLGSAALDSPVARWRQRAVELIGQHGGSQAPLLQALVCGYRPPIEATGSYEQFKTVGLAHLVAVSGAHLAIVTLFVSRGLRLARASRRATAVAVALFLAAYVGFTGVPVSALRAAVMAATGLLALVIDRRSSVLNALGGCLVVFVGLDPPCALSVSFVLSAGSTLGIVLLAPLFCAPAAHWPRWARSAVADPLALTAASSVATQPYAAALFAQVPLLAPLANVVAAPLFTVACVAGCAATLVALLVPAAAGAAIGGAALAAAPLEGVVGLLALVPGSCVPVDGDAAVMACLSVAAVGGLWAAWPVIRPRAAAGRSLAALAAVALVAAPAPHTADEIVMLNVGQGDAFLVRSQGSALLIDTGNRDTMLKEACARQNVRTLDRVAVTHPDDDHCGSLEALGQVASVGGMLVAEDLLGCPCASCDGLREVAADQGYGAGVQGLAVGDRVRCGRFTLEVLWPARFADEGGNGDSLSFLCTYDGDGDGAAEWTALFCGDAETEELRAMEPLLPEEGVDVLKVGHHGSKKSLDADLAERLSPSVALIGVGESNRYGHPAPEVCRTLEEVGASVLCSDEAGDVTVGFSMEKLTVTAQNDDGEGKTGTMEP